MKRREKLFWLGCTDSRSNNWIIKWENPSTDRVELFPMYHNMRCRRCDRIDELKALNSGLDSSVMIRSRRDILETCDSFICISNRMRDVFSRERITGVRLLQLPDKKYSLLIPDLIATTSAEGSGMQFSGRCKACGRYRYTSSWPSVVRIDDVSSDRFIAFPDTPMENLISRTFCFIITESVHRILIKHHATGYDSYDPLEALWSDGPR